jgi:hypothetical protein
MHRVIKKPKLDKNVSQSGNSGGVHSGNLMTSYLHDDLNDEDNMVVEMPIASPDATNNEVPVNTINPEHDQDDIATATPRPNEKLVSDPIVGNSSQTNSIEDTRGVTSAVDTENESTAVTRSSAQRRSGANDLNTMASGVSGMSLRSLNQLISSNGGSISGGLTLDKRNKSLKNLIHYIKVAYSNNLTSPKWKNFKGLKLQVIEKIRLNNVIWRTWFEQCEHSINLYYNILL